MSSNAAVGSLDRKSVVAGVNAVLLEGESGSPVAIKTATRRVAKMSGEEGAGQGTILHTLRLGTGLPVKPIA